MRALVLYSTEGGMETIARGLARGLESGGWQVQLMEAQPRGTAAISVGQYKLICVGSPVQGLFGGKIAGDLDLTLKRCSRMEGKHAFAFVRPKLFGNAKALRHLMGILEGQGAWVQDFANLTGADEAEQVSERLVHLRDQKGMGR